MHISMCRSAFIVICIVLQGCPGKLPPPYIEQYWEKGGEGVVEVSQALLECGANNPFHDPNLFPYPKGMEFLNEWAKVELCMIRDGYTYKRKTGTKCDRDIAGDLTICSPENEHLVPQRDVDARLNSAFCHDPWYSRYPACSQ